MTSDQPRAEIVSLTTPLSVEDVAALKVGQKVLLNGVIYTGRDAAHKRIVEAIEQGAEPPFDLEGQVIYYVGPAPAKPGRPIGSAGPTTSYRMDSYAPTLMRHGLRGSIGKGQRSQVVIDAMKEHHAVYFAAVGGAGALLGRCIVEAEPVAYEDLGTEMVRRLVVKDFPVVVVNDTRGGDLYQEGRKRYALTLG